MVSIENLNNPIPATKTATAVRGGSVPADFTVTVEGGRDITTVYVDLTDKKGKYIDTVVR